MDSFERNTFADLALKYINGTNRHIFLTGKAGTGKTTFLRQAKSICHKKCVVAAPTGIAAINAGGVTLHSLFQLPFGALVPDNNYNDISDRDFQLNTPKTLLGNFKMNASKRDMLRELELLIIDEVSMLRADVLDEIDIILRHIRRRRAIPFGGVQVLFIGDLFQLPPVTKNDEWDLLEKYYRSMYFFEAKVLKDTPPVYIELQKVYRQADNTFVSVLNNLRENKATKKDIQLLNTYYNPNFKSGPNDEYVYLTTHNYQADRINTQELNKLPGQAVTYEAEIEKDFSEHLYPIDKTLELKKDAQIMFIKNDPSGEKRFFNGKIGKIKSLGDDLITVQFTDGSEPVEVERYTWENKRFVLNKENNTIEEKIIGTFSHYPIKTAWAITVHKSQGLTFDKAIINVAGAFAPGQIYVALSRLTSLDGLVLTSRIPEDGIEQDKYVYDFASQKMEESKLYETLEGDTKTYIGEFVLFAFNFEYLSNEIFFHVRSYDKDIARSEKQKSYEWARELQKEFASLKEIADKFLVQLKSIIQDESTDYLSKLLRRTKAAKEYFEPLLKNMSSKVSEHRKSNLNKKGIKKYLKELKDLELLIYGQTTKILKAESMLLALINKEDLSPENLNTAPAFVDNVEPLHDKSESKKSTKKPKGYSQKISFDMFKEGKSIEDIAKERSLAESTIESHLAQFVSTGELDVLKILEKEKLENIIQASKKLDTYQLSSIKEIMGDEYSYADLRLAIAHLSYIEEKEEISGGNNVQKK